MSDKNATTLPDHFRFFETAEEGGVMVLCRRFIAIAETPRGYWVIDEMWESYWGRNNEAWRKKHRRFVLKDSVRRHCYPNKADAFASYLQRKRKHIQRLEFSLAVAKAAQEAAEKIRDMPQTIEAIGPRQELHCGRPEIFNTYTWE